MLKLTFFSAQIVFLFANDARVLKTWDPERGLGLPAWVGLVVERHTRAILRTDKRNPWTETPTEQAELETVNAPPLDKRIEDRHLLLIIAERLQQKVSPLGFFVFRRLFVDQCNDEHLCGELKMSPEALYVWRHRLRKHVRQIVDRLYEEESAKRGRG